jgi:hypothetical protein
MSLLMRLAVIVPPVAATATTSGLLKAGGLAAILVFVLALIAIALLDRFVPQLDLRTLLRKPGMPATETIDARTVSVGSGD